MPSAGDRADDEFVFVVNKAVNSSSSSSSSSFQSAAFASASKSSLTSSPVLFPKHRPAPRLNHLRPIPTSLGDCPTVSAAPEHLTHGSHTHPPLSLTATKAVATPLPPELLELLPPHLREKSTSSSWKDEVPRRPPLPYDFSLGDYSNVEDDSAPVAGAHAKERNVVSRSQSFTARETYKPVNGRSPLHNGKPQSPLSELESSIADLVSPLKNSSSYLNHSGTPLIKNTSSSPSSTSLKKATTVNGVPSFPPSPKFSRSTAASSTAVANAHPTNSTASGVKADPSSLTQVSYTAVLASDGEKAQFYRRLEAVTPTPAPFLNSFRASGSGSHHQASSSSHSRASPKPSGTSTPVSSPRSGSEPSNKNGGVKSQGSSSPVSDLRSARGQGPSRRTTPSSNSPRSSSPLSATGSSPTRRSCSRTEGVTSTSPSSSSSFPVVNGYSSSQDMDKAWNIVGVPPVSSSPQGFPSGSVHGSQSPVNRNWRTASPPVALHTSPSHSNYPDGDSIYDNLTVHPVRPQPIVACSAPSVPPCLANGFAPPPASPTAHLGARSPTPTSSISLSRPGTPAGKPPSPPMQRRAGSRSPTPHQRQKPQPQPLPQQQLRSHVTTPPPTGAHFVAPVPHTYFVPVDRGVGGDGGGYWAAAGSGMYGSSPQLCPPGGGAVPVYCQYVYSPHPYGFLPFDGRAHSCERLAGDPVLVAAAPAATATAAVPVVHPASSPRVGRRSVSPCLQQNALPVQPGAPAPVGFRSSSCSPVPGQRRSGTRHSPSPDPGGATGKPPRPRRPHPVRKAKTVEVGYLGQGVSSTGAPSPTSTSSKVLVSPTAHVSVPAPAHASPAGVKVPSFETLHQQIRECSQAPPKRDAKQATSVFHDSLREERELLIKLRQKQKEQLEQLEQLKLQERKRQEQAASDGGKGKGSNASSRGGSTSLEERVQRLEGDKDSLQLQVTVLSEQVEAQTEKINELESMLDQKKQLLSHTEELLQKEVLMRSSLETQRLELLSEISNLKLCQASFERENSELKEKLWKADQQAEQMKSQLAAHLASSPTPSTISTLSTIAPSSPDKIKQPPPAPAHSTPVSEANARDLIQPRVCKTPPPNARRKIEQFGTIPRQKDAAADSGALDLEPRRTKGVMFGKGLQFLHFRVAGKRSTSAPNLAETERHMIEEQPEGGRTPEVGGGRNLSTGSTIVGGHRSPPAQHRPSGIRKIFTKLRRSSSGHLDSDLGDGDFKRGGMRATASARLGWTAPPTRFMEPSESFMEWSVDSVINWLGDLGLTQYGEATRSWMKGGNHISKANQQHLERDLGIRHPLHRKKLQLQISARLCGSMTGHLARLDHSWVLRWLDDVGLPQYKDAFSEARVDGRVLNYLTYDDIAFLRVTNLLHLTSLKRGIQVLREHGFDASVLKRRSVPEEENTRPVTPNEVSLWTNHRVMEWLRTVDLSEYAPNLRGSGVHGALMVYETKFTSELLASLLSIPAGKTLLRRHLNTHFKELVGKHVVQEKRELEASSGYSPLTTYAKVKMPKRSQFTLKRKKSKSELEFDDLICPLDERSPLAAVCQNKETENQADGNMI